mgnify:CR=1 FL=1
MKSVIAIDMLNPRRTKVYASIAEAADALFVDPSTISRAASGDRNCRTAAGKVIVFA